MVAGRKMFEQHTFTNYVAHKFIKIYKYNLFYFIQFFIIFTYLRNTNEETK